MKTRPRRVGLYGGTFDPIHLGHMNLALEIREKHRLDWVWFCPVNRSPGRLNHQAAPAKHRLKMVELAVAPVAGFGALDFEVKRQGPSYTIDTVRELDNSAQTLFLVMSDEVAATMATWKESKNLLKLAPPLIGRRIVDQNSAPKTGEPSLDQVLARGYTSTPVFEISGTALRKRLCNQLYCGHLLPAPVLAYIQEHRLYQE